MVKHIVIVSDRKQDNVSVYTEEPAFVAIADRQDMNALKKLNEANRAGIYILIGEDKRYIGQSATSIYSRLSLHNKDIPWWTQVIFFGREDGHLDKSQTDYLEAKLIKEFRQTSFLVTNQTEGNSSWIDKTSKIHAKNVWTIAQTILLEVANIDLFENTVLISETEKETGMCWIKLPNGDKVFGKNPSNNQIKLFEHLIRNDDYKELVEEQIIKGKPSSRQLLGTEAVFDKQGRPRCAKLDDSLFLYTNLSTKDREKALLRFADQIGLTIDINWN